MYASLLWRLWDLVALLVWILCTSLTGANLSGYILEIQNIFVLINGPFRKRNNVWKRLRFQSFILVWHLELSTYMYIHLIIFMYTCTSLLNFRSCLLIHGFIQQCQYSVQIISKQIQETINCRKCFTIFISLNGFKTKEFCLVFV